MHLYLVRVRTIPNAQDYPEIDPKLALRRIPAEVAERYCDDPDLALSKEFVTAANSRGDLFFGAFDGDLLVSYIWRSLSSAPDADGVWIRVHKPYNYSYNSYTRPGYRGQRISPVVHLFSDNAVYALGYRYRIGFVEITNFASIEMGKYMGSKKIGYAGYVICFGNLIPFRSSAVKATGFEFFKPS